MNFKVDENLPAELVEDLRTAGHVADTVSGQGMAGAADSTLLAHVRSEARAFLTMDKGSRTSAGIRRTSMRGLCSSGHEPQAAAPCSRLSASTCRTCFNSASTAIYLWSLNPVFASADRSR